MACTFCSIWSGSQRKHAAAECVTTRLLGGRTVEVSFRALVGCCHNRIHPGKLTRKLMEAHDCLGKECRFFEKYEDADYWREKNRKAAAKKKHRQKQTLEKAQQRREADALTWAVTGQIIRAVTILVVFCPCALVLATPTAIMAAIGNATKHGFLVRKGDALERLARVKILAFDKTGTLTCGTPEVVAVESLSDAYTNVDLYRLAACAEQLSEHTLGKAIVRCCKRDLGAELTAAQDFRMIPGRGVAATVEGVQLLAGNPELFKSEGVDFAVPASAEAHLQQGATITYLAVNGVFAGYIALSDTLRAESADTIRQLTALGVQPVLLTGDHASAANAIAGQLGIREVRANCLPQDKLHCIDEFQQKGEPVCNAGSVLVIINSALLLNWRKKA